MQFRKPIQDPTLPPSDMACQIHGFQSICVGGKKVCRLDDRLEVGAGAAETARSMLREISVRLNSMHRNIHILS